jgi:hypothetical protein
VLVGDEAFESLLTTSFDDAAGHERRENDLAAADGYAAKARAISFWTSGRSLKQSSALALM